MRLKVGDKSEVMKFETMVNRYGIAITGNIRPDQATQSFITHYMREFCGQQVIITEKVKSDIGSYYAIQEDAGTWCWEDWMFEDSKGTA